MKRPLFLPFLFLLSPILVAQPDTPCTVGPQPRSSVSGSSIPGKPYVAQVHIIYVLQLGNGNATRSVNYVESMRNKDGMTLEEQPLRCFKTANGTELWKQVAVHDPAHNTTTLWRINGPYAEKRVEVIDLTPVEVPKKTPAEQEHQRLLDAANNFSSKEWVSEDLGTRNIGGLDAKGHRLTRTIPVGEEGNDFPLKVVQETWTNQEYGITLLSINDDPRMGRTEIEVQHLDKIEPPAISFVPPSEWRVIHTKNDDR